MLIFVVNVCYGEFHVALWQSSPQVSASDVKPAIKLPICKTVEGFSSLDFNFTVICMVSCMYPIVIRFLTQNHVQSSGYGILSAKTEGDLVKNDELAGNFHGFQVT